MPNDYVTIKALSQELNNLLKGGKVDKVTMPEIDEVNLFVRANNQNYNLAISCNASNPKIHLTHQKKPSPITAHPFCMHLRKYLQNGNIENIYTLNEDRIIVIEIKSKNEMRDIVSFKLIAEMMGRYSNIIMVNQNGIITDALKQVPFDVMTKRTLIPSQPYTIPEQPKIKLSELDKIEKVLKTYSGTSISQFLLNNVSGFAKSTSQEVVKVAGIEDNKQEITNEDILKIINAISTFDNIISSSLFAPCVSMVNGNPNDYFVFKYSSISEYKSYKTLNDAIENCLMKKDDEYRQAEKTKYLLKAFNAFKSKCTKRLEKSNQRLAEASSKDIYKMYGELITANIYRIKKGDEKAVVNNYYEEDNREISINLDSTLSPQANAQQYFKKYNKLKHTEEVSLEQKKELEETLNYLDTILPYISRAKTQNEILELQRELESIGALRAQKVKGNKKAPEAAPIHYNFKGFNIYVGKNNLQNDRLTFRIANGGDIWLHTKAYHGSHTIIMLENKEINDEIIQFAAEICAFYSNCDNTSKVEVDYTQRKNVKRHPNKNPGMVLYEIYQTANVVPNEHKEYLLKV